MRLRTSIGLIALLLLTTPSGASAANRTIAPPGNSAVGQYVESVPTATGGRPTNTIHPHSGSFGGPGGSSGGPGGSSGGPGGSLGSQGGSSSGLGAGVIPARAARALSARGRAGRSAAELAVATAPHRAKASGNGGVGSSPASSVAKALTGSGSSGPGLGVLLPVILVGSAIAGGAISIARRRRAT